MKRIIFFASICLMAINLHSQSYQKLVDSANKWNYLDLDFMISGRGEAKTYSLFITTDTVIENKTYKKVMCRTIRQDSDDIVYAAAIREDDASQAVFIKFETFEEKKIYSFNHNVGDTISVDTTFYKNAYTVRSVKNVGTFNFNGTQRKKIEICDTTYRINHPRPDLFPPEEIYTDFWYEGIGSFKSFINFNSQDYGGFYGQELLCFWNGDTQIYQSPDWDVCEYAEIRSGLKETLNSPDIEIFQHPATGQITIKTNEQVDSVMLTDLRGAIVLIQDNKSDIDINRLSNGIYILRVKTKTKEIVRKIVKNYNK